MFDHISLEVKNLKETKEFYKKVFLPFGYKVWVEEGDFVGFGDEKRPYFWLNQSQNRSDVHIAFPAKNRKTVDEFYKIAIETGAKDDGSPGLRPEYHEDYYGAFVLDPEGNSIEAVCHKSIDEQVNS